MTQDIFLIDSFFHGFCYPSGRWHFYRLHLIKMHKSEELLKNYPSVFVLENRHYHFIHQGQLIRELQKFYLKIFRGITGIISATDLKWCNSLLSEINRTADSMHGDKQ